MGRNLDADDRESHDYNGGEREESSKMSTNSPRLTLPLLKRVEDLELNMRSLEGRYSPRSVIVDSGANCWSSSSARSSSLSTPSSARIKPILDALEEVEKKGTLVERVAHLEDRLDTVKCSDFSISPRKALIFGLEFGRIGQFPHAPDDRTSWTQLSMHLHSGEWTAAQVPALTSPAAGKAAGHVAEARPEDAPAGRGQSGEETNPQKLSAIWFCSIIESASANMQSPTLCSSQQVWSSPLSSDSPSIFLDFEELVLQQDPPWLVSRHEQPHEDFEQECLDDVEAAFVLRFQHRFLILRFWLILPADLEAEVAGFPRSPLPPVLCHPQRLREEDSLPPLACPVGQIDSLGAQYSISKAGS
ncbi:hypothetical protein SELMODRAFT_441210 [Selaginella moellendorffii]|uniref:Uncharacterized protein n=1 Tax=Selaginella moellendorffii TaxID=88036 RepID=D8RHD0_SELML|nr:hypothetical protein SELMODRAFT_441210 [Selaginella moellendorffii]